jgi:hypothetical protein
MHFVSQVLNHIIITACKSDKELISPIWGRGNRPRGVTIGAFICQNHNGSIGIWDPRMHPGIIGFLPTLSV